MHDGRFTAEAMSGYLPQRVIYRGRFTCGDPLFSTSGLRCWWEAIDSLQRRTGNQNVSDGDPEICREGRLSETDEWVDVVTLAVPRSTITTTIPSLLARMDTGGIRIRWIVHYDPVDCLASNYHAVLDSIHRAAKEFDASVILTPSRNVGHATSFLTCLRHVANDFLYWEDDKLCTTDFRLRDISAASGDHISLQGRAGRAGHTSASFWRKRVADSILAEWPSTGMEGCLEDWLKRLCRRHQFRSGPRLRYATDIGIHELASHSVRRVRGADGNPLYVEAPSNTALVTYIAPSTLGVFRRNLPSWRWRLSIDACRFYVFAPSALHIHLRALLPSRLTTIVDWEPGECDEPDYRWLGILTDLVESEYEFLICLSPSVAARKQSIHLMEIIAEYDIVTLRGETGASLLSIRRQWLQFALAHLFAERRGEVDGNCIWRYAEETGAHHRNLHYGSIGLIPCS